MHASHIWHKSSIETSYLSNCVCVCLKLHHQKKGSFIELQLLLIVRALFWVGVTQSSLLIICLFSSAFWFCLHSALLVGPADLVVEILKNLVFLSWSIKFHKCMLIQVL
uniref:Uncharacterized protein n=1 Tax=Rhizophora mucronata TaxID=61149 RepID=A0A2P2PT81_RHIMU